MRNLLFRLILCEKQLPASGSSCVRQDSGWQASRSVCYGSKSMNVSIIGTGYVGLTTGACLAFLGHKVTCIDSDERKIALLQAGQTPIYEPFLTQLLAEADGNIRFTTDYAEAIPDA